MDAPATAFAHRVPVPGLADMAKPAFAEVGKKSGKRQAFWYRREFTLKQAVPEIAPLKVHKAQFGTKVWLNIHDEFPIWLLGGTKNQCPEWPVAEKIIPQYTEWMRERWNHPRVVIWDAQNESGTPETGKALSAARKLDLSDRPRENGWAEPRAPTDCVESHPYMHIRGWWPKGKPFKMSEIAGMDGKPKLNEAQQALDVPIIIRAPPVTLCWRSGVVGRFCEAANLSRVSPTRRVGLQRISSGE